VKFLVAYQAMPIAYNLLPVTYILQQLINWFTLFPQYRGRFVYKMLKPIKTYNVKILK
jgi:hypothetical protein